MTVDAAYLRDLYDRSSDEELLRIAGTDLVDEARGLLNEELTKRGLKPPAGRANAIVYLSGRSPEPFNIFLLPLRGFLGVEALWRVYWLGVMLPAFVLGVVNEVTAGGSGLRLVYLLLTLTISAWGSVAVWRCSRNVTPNYFWAGFLARIWAAATALSIAYVSFTWIVAFIRRF